MFIRGLSGVIINSNHISHIKKEQNKDYYTAYEAGDGNMEWFISREEVERLLSFHRDMLNALQDISLSKYGD